MSDQQDSAPAQNSSNVANVQSLKSQIANKLQASRPLVLKLHSILTWEKEFHPAMVFGFITILYFSICLLNSSVLTTLSYLGIAGALIDLAMPTIAKNLCGPSASKPNDGDNQKFDKICLELAKIYALFLNSCNACRFMKNSKPKVYYPSLLATLLVLAYIGNKVHNLFLTYLVTLFIALYPGLEKNGIPQRCIGYVYRKLGRPSPVQWHGKPEAGGHRASGKRN